MGSVSGAQGPLLGGLQREDSPTSKLALVGGGVVDNHLQAACLTLVVHSDHIEQGVYQHLVLQQLL